MVAKAVNSFPQQGLWTVLAVVKSSNKERASRGYTCLQKITVRPFPRCCWTRCLNMRQEFTTKHKTESSSSPDIQRMINQGQKFSEELLRLCLVRVEGRVSRVDLARDLGFNHKVAPCRLVVPFQAMLIPSLPTSHDSEYLKGFRPFPRDPTTIEGTSNLVTTSGAGLIMRCSCSGRGPGPELPPKTTQNQHSRIRRQDLQCTLQAEG